MKNRNNVITIILLALGFLALCPIPKAFGVVPPPDGAYPGFNTAEGQNALLSLNTGVGFGNTAVGWFSLKSDTEGSFNTAIGAGTLLLNVGDQSTGDGTGNTAVGAAALLLNTTGHSNVAVGVSALQSNTTGFLNTAVGSGALASNINTIQCNAVGFQALYNNNSSGVSGSAGFNNAHGAFALFNNVDGTGNDAFGDGALYFNVSGHFNTAIGYHAGSSITGTGNVCIGSSMGGVAGQDNRTWIENVYFDVATERAVFVDSDGHIGTLSSSRRYKEQIKSMDKASETLYGLKPVTFRYKKKVDPSQALSFGLIAEDVAQVSPELITRDEEGKPQTVRYEAVNAMLLNEFLKEHRKVQLLEKTIVEQQTENAATRAMLKEQAAQIQKVSAQVQLNSAPAIAENP